MKRITTLVAVMMFAFLGAPLAALADQHESGEKAKADANANANPQWSEDAKKGAERAAERHDGAAAKVKTRGAEAADAKAQGDKAKADAKATADKAKGSAKATADKAQGDAAKKANDAIGGASADAKAKVDAAVPGIDAGAEAEAGGAAK